MYICVSILVPGYDDVPACSSSQAPKEKLPPIPPARGKKLPTSPRARADKIETGGFIVKTSRTRSRTDENVRKDDRKLKQSGMRKYLIEQKELAHPKPLEHTKAARARSLSPQYRRLGVPVSGKTPHGRHSKPMWVRTFVLVDA